VGRAFSYVFSSQGKYSCVIQLKIRRGSSHSSLYTAKILRIHVKINWKLIYLHIVCGNSKNGKNTPRCFKIVLNFNRSKNMKNAPFPFSYSSVDITCAYFWLERWGGEVKFGKLKSIKNRLVSFFRAFKEQPFSGSVVSELRLKIHNESECENFQLCCILIKISAGDLNIIKIFIVQDLHVHAPTEKILF